MDLSSWRDRVVRVAPSWLVDPVPRDHRESDEAFQRRRRVTATTSVVGAGLLGLSLSRRPDSSAFYRLTGAVAATWVTGGFASGPLHLGREYSRRDQDRLVRPVITPVATGAVAFGAFYAAGVVAKRIPVLDRAVSSILAFADQGHTGKVLLTTLANGVAEEVFFRGAVYAAAGVKHPVAVSTAVYTIATVPTRNPSLVIAAGAMGTLFGLQRRATGGIQAPLLTHVTWSALMLRFMPPLFRKHPAVPVAGQHGANHA